MAQTGPVGIKGSRLLPSVLDELGSKYPDRIYASIPRTDDLTQGFQDITHGQVLRAVDGLALWLSQRIGLSHCFDTLSYAGIGDLRYVIFFYAAVKCGYKVLFISPRNTIEQNVSLFKQTNCRSFYYSVEMEGLASQLSEAMESSPLETTLLATFDHWQEAHTTPFPFSKSFEEARFDPIVVLHSSGSTGAPKPIVQTHQYFANSDRPLPSVHGKQIGGMRLWDCIEGFYFSPFPPYHLAGFHSLCYYPVFGRACSALLGYPDRPATLEMLLQILKMKSISLLYAPPSLIEGLVRLEGAIDEVRKLKHIIYAGGPLSKETGDELVKHTTLSPIYGSTETSSIACFVPPADSWQYLQFHPAWKVIMQPTLDKAYELVLRKDAEADKYRGIGGTILREQHEYRTRDIFVQHPANPKLWKFYGRNDDIIVFSNGQKWNPLPSESTILGSFDLSGVLIVGDGRFQPAALLEPQTMDQGIDDLVERTRPFVERANMQAQSFGRLLRSMITVVEPGGFIRAPKGTVVRKATAEKYSAVISKLYAQKMHVSRENHGKTMKSLRNANISLSALVSDCVSKLGNVNYADTDRNLFTAGLNSLTAMELVRSITGALTEYANLEDLERLTVPMLYQYTTIRTLTQAIECILAQAPDLSAPLSGDYLKDWVDKFQVPAASHIRRSGVHSETKSLHIAVVGSTGTLGPNIIESLIKSSQIGHITCLDRSSLSEERRKAVYKNVPMEPETRISFQKLVVTELSPENMNNYRSLFQGVDVVLFSAWTVDFNHSIDHFEPLLRGLSSIISLLSSFEQSPRLFFISSLSAVSRFNESTPTLEVTESVSFDSEKAAATGYGQSKHVAERLLANAASQMKTPITILRIGQIAGYAEDEPTEPHQHSPNPPVWNDKEWFPSIIKSSSQMECIPMDLDRINWLPVNKVSQIIEEIIVHDMTKENEGASAAALRVYNLANPQPVDWKELLPCIQQTLCERPKLVPFREWIFELKGRDTGPEAVRLLPALKILDYLEQHHGGAREAAGLVRTEQARGASPTLSRIEPVNEAWMRQWLRGWGYDAAV